MNKRKAALTLASVMLATSLFTGCTAISKQKENTKETETTSVTGEEDSISNQEEKEPEGKEPVVTSVTITATGDCTFAPTQNVGYAGTFHEFYDNYGPDYFFSGVKDVFEQDDFTLINLECVLTESNDRVEKTFNLKGRPEYAKILPLSSIEGCSMANNHTHDYGEVGFEDTKANVNSVNVPYAYNDEVGVYTTKDGIKIGFVSANLLSQSPENEAYLENGIKKLKEENTDIIIATCHWGIEREYYPLEYQREVAHKCIDWGADLLIGTHPHVLQGMEEYNGKIICYSLGNFCFGGNRNPSDKDTMLYQQTFTFVDGQKQDEIEAKMIPCTISGHSNYNDYQPTIASGDKKQSIINHMNEYCAPYSRLHVDEEGILLQNRKCEVSYENKR